MGKLRSPRAAISERRYAGRRESLFPHARLEEGRVHHVEPMRPVKMPTATSMRSSVKRTGPMTIVAHEHFKGEDLSVAAQMTKIKAAGPDVLVGWTTGTPFGTVLRNMSEAGLGIPILTTAGDLSDAQMRGYASSHAARALHPRDPRVLHPRPDPARSSLSARCRPTSMRSKPSAPNRKTEPRWRGTERWS